MTTLAGSPFRTAGYVDGYGSVVRFNQPIAIYVDTTSIYAYISDGSNGRIRKMIWTGGFIFLDSFG